MKKHSLDTLKLITEILRESSLEETLTGIIRFTTHLHPDVQPAILLYDEKKRVLYRGAAPDFLMTPEESAATLDVRANSVPAARAAFFKKAEYSLDVSKDESFPFFGPFYNRNRIKSVWAHPVLSSQEDVLGVVIFFLPQLNSPLDLYKETMDVVLEMTRMAIEKVIARKQKEAYLAELQENQKRLNLALSVRKMGVWDYNVNLDQLRFDENALYLFGLTQVDFGERYQDFAESIHPEDRERVAQVVTEAIRQKKLYFAEYRIFKNGEIRHMTGLGNPFIDPASSHLIYTGITWDRTDEVHNQEKLQLEQAKSVSNAKMASLGEMATGIAHEVNNPLTIIMNRVETLRAALEQKGIQRDFIFSELNKMQETVGRISKVVKGLSAFSRNADQDPFISVDSYTVIEDAVELSLEKLKSEGIQVEIELSKEAYISCRPSQIAQVLLNLINNSYDAIQSSENPWVQIRSEIENEQLIISVTDSGQGIEEPIVEKLMQPFFTTKKVGKGTGLGLSISKGLIEDHDGQLYYDRSSKNTCFKIHLPLSPRASKSSTNPSNISQGHSSTFSLS
ncbi:MAG: PAS domain-containing sensor histidine kinase [Proteobacteria bacterium]|jgi:C4-dicarboxylate-specific signal transduction histidine kinase|nr:PAS domain-containing sensor histidine kinase [Pseudomonadota bacterium]